MTGTVGINHQCTECKKTYKTKSGLTRHQKRYHEKENMAKFDKEILIEMINKTKKTFYENKNYLMSEREAVLAADPHLCTEKIFNVVLDFRILLYVLCNNIAEYN